MRRHLQNGVDSNCVRLSVWNTQVLCQNDIFIVEISSSPTSNFILIFSELKALMNFRRDHTMTHERRGVDIWSITELSLRLVNKVDRVQWW